MEPPQRNQVALLKCLHAVGRQQRAVVMRAVGAAEIDQVQFFAGRAQHHMAMTHSPITALPDVEIHIYLGFTISARSDDCISG